MEKDEMKLDKMRDALTAIVHEIQLYNNSSKTNSSQNVTDHEDIFKQVMRHKSLLRSKNKLIKKLQENLKMACVVAKTMISAKENEKCSLNNLLRFKKCECADLHQKNIKSSQVILKLSEQNKTLQNKLDTMTNFIEIGFKQIPNSSINDKKESSVINKLKQIIIYSGNSLANIKAKNERNLQLEQDNCLLKYKINNLCNNNVSLSKELKRLNYLIIKLKKEKFMLKNISKTKLIDGNCMCYSESWVHAHGNFNDTSMKEIVRISTDRDLNLTVHLSIAKKLLHDQSELLQHLNHLTQEIITT